VNIYCHTQEMIRTGNSPGPMIFFFTPVTGIDNIYINKLDEFVTDKFYKKMTQQWKEEQDKILMQIEKHQKANVNYFEMGIKILELSKRLYSTYLEKNNEGKREILNIILSNCSLNAGNLCPNYRRPFDLLVKGPSRSVWLPLLDTFRTFKGNLTIENIRLIS